MRPDLDERLAAAGRGDQAAFKAIYDATSGRFLAIALAIVRRRDAAEDVVQEAYLRIWANARGFDPARGKAMPWMASILRNGAIERLRRERPADDIDAHADTLPAAAVPVESAVDLIRCLDMFGGLQRVAMHMTYVDGFTSAEVAQQLGVPLGTVKAWIRRGGRRIHARFAA